MEKALNPTNWIEQVQAAETAIFRCVLADSVSYLCPECARREVLQQGNTFQLVQDGVMKVYADIPESLLSGVDSENGQ